MDDAGDVDDVEFRETIKAADMVLLGVCSDSEVLGANDELLLAIEEIAVGVLEEVVTKVVLKPFEVALDKVKREFDDVVMEAELVETVDVAFHSLDACVTSLPRPDRAEPGAAFK